jgi:exopolyphosphatase/guanosine-5'-triphosphate,3'-diphosphate pyrophosphatase
MVGLAGTISTVAAVEIGLATYDRDRIHHFVLTRHAAEDVYRTLATEPRADRIHNPGLEEARADVIVGGCIVLVGVMRFFGFERCLVSEADILDGIALGLLGRNG